MSLVTMARKVKAQQGVSKKGFSLNGTYKESGAARSTVKTSLTSRRNRYNTAVCFGGEEGIQCERVWDGKKEVPKDGGMTMGAGDSIRASEYIDKLRYTAARCKNLLFNSETIGQIIKVILNTETNNYMIETGGKRYQAKWYNSNMAIKNIADTSGGDVIIDAVSAKGRRTTTVGVVPATLSELQTATFLIKDAYDEVGTLVEPTLTVPERGLIPTDTVSPVKDFYVQKAYANAVALKTAFAKFTLDGVTAISTGAWDGIVDTANPALIFPQDIGTTIVITNAAGNSVTYLQNDLRHFTLKTNKVSFENPEMTIFEPVGCDSLSQYIKPDGSGAGGTGSGLGGAIGRDQRGYYGRGSCKVTYVNKDPAFEPKGYDGPGGYLDMVKMPHDDTARYCG